MRDTTIPVTVVVMAKRPVPGRVKTRLCPPCTPRQAAAIAAAALADTIAAVAAARVPRRVLALDRTAGFAAPPGFALVGQRGDGLAERLASAAAALAGPVLIVGMDTPQVDRARLEHAARTLLEPGVDAVLGPASDGGYWTIGLRSPRAAVFDGVPMSRSDTADEQRARLRVLGARTVELCEQRDVDTFDDALAVAALAPRTRFARAVGAVACSPELVGAGR
ncbi:MAG TPA: DUF2064 domain-containing protein [Acidimicrobiia bacterium]|nr:DUF2064 domain-containing protein [Acidimicrobiia bacterium]